MKITRNVLEGLTGVKSRRTEFYILQDFYDDLEITGRGSPTHFKERHVVETYLANELRDNGVELATIKRIVNWLRNDKQFLILFDKSGNLKQDVKSDYTGERNVRNYVFIWGRAEEIEFSTDYQDEKRRVYRGPSFSRPAAFFAGKYTINPMSGESTGQPLKTVMIVEITEVFQLLAKR